MTTPITTTSHQRSLEQKRAKAAWEAVNNAKQNKEYQKSYKSTVRDAPASIQQNGLGQTLAFWLAKKKEQEKQDLYASVSAWVKVELKWTEPKELLPWIVEHAETDEYRRATSEAMAFLGWVKRFAEAELED